METRTIKRVIAAADPRHELCARLGISAQYGSAIKNDQAIGGTETLAKVAGLLGFSDQEIGASVREWFPKAFEVTPIDLTPSLNPKAA